MVNYRVRDLDAMLAQLRAAGAEVDEKVEEEENGRFGWAFDPEGNRFELWEPRALDRERSPRRAGRRSSRARASRRARRGRAPARSRARCRCSPRRRCPSPSSAIASTTSPFRRSSSTRTIAPPCSSAFWSSSLKTSASAVARPPASCTGSSVDCDRLARRRGPERASRAGGRAAPRARPPPHAAPSAPRAPRRSRGSG